MKALILAAGYATRMYPLTEKNAKPLLEVGNKPIIDHIVEKVKSAGIEEVMVITNDKFYEDFKKWGNAEVIINDGSTHPDNRLGAIKDIYHVIEHETLDDDLIVVAGDGLFDFDFNQFLNYARDKKAVLVGHPVPIEEAHKYGNMIVENNMIIDFEEKPKNPRSNISSIAVYYFNKEVLPHFESYLSEGHNTDAPGHFIEWLCKKEDVHSWINPGTFLDIGSIDGLEEARRLYEPNN